MWRGGSFEFEVVLMIVALVGFAVVVLAFVVAEVVAVEVAVAIAVVVRSHLPV